MQPIYLDANATAPLRPEVVAVMQEVLAMPSNPSSVHRFGRTAKQKLEAARETIAQSIGAFAHELSFAASGTELNNMVLRGAGDYALLVAEGEHSSIEKTGRLLGADRIPLDENGILRLDLLESKLTALGRPALVSVMLANNETGVIQPIREIADIVHRYQGVLHTDAVQALGKIPVDVGLLGCDAMTLCAHKMGGAVGVGVLWAKEMLRLRPLVTGGGQERGTRAGTENLAAIVGMATSIELAKLKHWQEKQGWLRQMEAEILAVCPPAAVAGVATARLPNTSCILMPGISSETQLIDFDLQGIAVSAGSACSSGRIEPSQVLTAMGYAPSLVNGAIRVSLAWNSTEDEVRRFTAAWIAIWQRLGAKAKAS